MREPSEAAPLVFEPVRASDALALGELFPRAGSGCYCRYWHFSGDKNAWLDRLAHAPEENAAELARDLASDALAPHGIVARRGPAIVGWMKLVFAARLEKLYAARPYRNLECFSGDRSRVLGVGCFLVDPGERRRGVARGLLRAGIVEARRLGASAVEAFPRKGEHLGDEELWMGPASVFSAEGFEIVNEWTPYPVLRLAL